MMVVASVESYRTWIDQNLEEPERRRLASRALDAFERLEIAASIATGELRPILDAVKCHYVRVWEIGADLLNRLAFNHQAAQEALIALLHEKKASVRFQSIALLGWSSVPTSLASCLIRLGLCDKSYEVRGRVAEAAYQLGLVEVIPDLEGSLVTEKHSVARYCMEFAVALLRDGYLLQRDRGKLTNVWVKRERERGYCTSVPITDDDLNAGRLASIIAGAKSRP